MIHHNLLPDDWLRRLLIRRRLRQWAVVWIASFLVCLTASLVMHLTHLRHRTRFENVRQAALPVQQTAKEVQQLQNRLKLLEGREALLGALESGSHPFQLLGIVGTSSHSNLGTIRVGDFTISTSQSSQNTSPAPQSAAPVAVSHDVELTVSGIASDDIAIAQFVAELRSYEMFDKVVLVSSESRNEETDRQFRVDCRFTK